MPPAGARGQENVSKLPRSPGQPGFSLRGELTRMPLDLNVQSDVTGAKFHPERSRARRCWAVVPVGRRLANEEGMRHDARRFSRKVAGSLGDPVKIPGEAADHGWSLGATIAGAAACPTRG